MQRSDTAGTALQRLVSRSPSSPVNSVFEKYSRGECVACCVRKINTRGGSDARVFAATKHHVHLCRMNGAVNRTVPWTGVASIGARDASGGGAEVLVRLEGEPDVAFVIAPDPRNHVSSAAELVEGLRALAPARVPLEGLAPGAPLQSLARRLGEKSSPELYLAAQREARSPPRGETPPAQDASAAAAAAAAQAAAAAATVAAAGCCCAVPDQNGRAGAAAQAEPVAAAAGAAEAAAAQPRSPITPATQSTEQQQRRQRRGDRSAEDPAAAAAALRAAVEDRRRQLAELDRAPLPYADYWDAQLDLFRYQLRHLPPFADLSEGLPHHAPPQPAPADMAREGYCVELPPQRLSG